LYIAENASNTKQSDSPNKDFDKLIEHMGSGNLSLNQKIHQINNFLSSKIVDSHACDEL
jgi:hypothetical protein